MNVLFELESMFGMLLFECLLCGMWFIVFGVVVFECVKVMIKDFDYFVCEMEVVVVGYVVYLYIGVILFIFG